MIAALLLFLAFLALFFYVQVKVMCRGAEKADRTFSSLLLIGGAVIGSLLILRVPLQSPADWIRYVVMLLY